MSNSGGVAVTLGNIVGTPTNIDARTQADGQSAGLNALATWTVIAGMTNTSVADRLRTPNVFKVVNVVAIGAEATIWTPAAGKKFRLMGFVLAHSAPGYVTFKDNTAGTTIFRFPQAVADAPLATNLGNGILSVAANNVLTAIASSAGNLNGVVYGTEE